MRVGLLFVVAAVLLGCDEHKPRPVDDCGSDCDDAGVIVDAGSDPDAAVDAGDLDAGDGGDA